jgi:hypothetical protein
MAIKDGMHCTDGRKGNLRMQAPDLLADLRCSPENAVAGTDPRADREAIAGGLVGDVFERGQMGVGNGAAIRSR